MSPDTLSTGGPNVLPHGWTWASLGQLGSWTGGGTPSKSLAAFWVNGSIPWVSPKDMKAEIIRDTEDHITEEAVAGSATKFVPGGSVLMVMRSGILRHTFPVAVNADRVTVNQDLRALIPAEGINPNYVAHYLRGIQRQVLDRCSKDGTTVQSIEVSALERVLVPIAPAAEQRRIVARIDELFAEIAEGEAALERARQGLDTWRRALLKAAVTGELTRDWREANRPNETGADLLARIRAERGASFPRGNRTCRRAPSDSSCSGLLPQLPEGWGWATLGECISHLTSGSRDWSQYYDQGSAIFIMAQNIRPGRYNHSYVKHVAPPAGDPETTRTAVRKNDLLVTIVGANTGDVCRVDFEADNYFVCQSVALARPRLCEMSGFLELYFVARDGGRGEFEKVIYGAGRPHLSFDQLLATRVPIPSLTEMQEIVERVRLQEEAAFSEQEFAGFHRDLLALRQSTLKAAFEGRLVPQDPTDESASELLARLRNNFPSNGARRRRTQTAAGFSHPSLPGLTRLPVDPRVEPADDE